jgi:hypothetical protein
MAMTFQDLMEIHGPLKEAQYLYEACAALEHCFERLGYSENDIRDLLSDDFFDWWKHEPAAEYAQEQKYEAAMTEKRGKALRKHWPANVAALDCKSKPRRLCTAAEYERLSREGGTCPYCGSVFPAP